MSIVIDRLPAGSRTGSASSLSSSNQHRVTLDWQGGTPDTLQSGAPASSGPQPYDTGAETLTSPNNSVEITVGYWGPDGVVHDDTILMRATSPGVMPQVIYGKEGPSGSWDDVVIVID